MASPNPSPLTGRRTLGDGASRTEPRPVEVHDPKLFLNREISWLAFNERVLAEARDASLPLFERLKFLSIVSSNLDEFFMVRVAGLKQQILGGVAETAADGMLPGEQLAAIADRTHAMISERDRVWSAEIRPSLAAHGLTIPGPAHWTPEQQAAARNHFTSQVFPALTPLAIDPGHPFPHLRNKSINVAVFLRPSGGRRRATARGSSLAVVQVPAVLGRLVRLPSAEGLCFGLLEEIIAANVGDLFPGYAVKHTAAFRVTRNWDLLVDEEDSEDLLSTIQEELRRRDRGAAVRLEVAADSPPETEGALSRSLHLEPPDVYRVQAPLQLPDLLGLAEADPRPELRVEPLAPSLPMELRDVESVVGAIGKRDILLHHPYESFDPVVRFIDEAADDPNVLAIKQTLYRTSGDSPFVRALSRAAENGKQVTAIVEIKARFDEANNIAWARRLEENGVHVVYGLIGLKTHCKVALVVRREGGGIRRYVHLGTGNYNPVTARQYTDLSLFTAKEEFGEDVSFLFNMLTGYSEPPHWKRLAVAPLDLQDRVLELIGRAAQRARAGEPARIVAKMNSLADPAVIRALYAASQAGVEIELIVRGICCLRPGLPGVSERIRVVSVVDRFLEHSRVLAFGVGDRAEVYVASADWMPRNFHRRIEVLFPILDPALKHRLLGEVLGLALRDSVKARRLQVDGRDAPAPPSDPPVRSQVELLQAARVASQPPRIEPVIRQNAAPLTPETSAPTQL
ncbi:MAG TPA: polyphosphate kinase 1 [Myxococcales bacterium]|nr:polyphosphate kinase 1 [Myxococcales bacterium]